MIRMNPNEIPSRLSANIEGDFWYLVKYDPDIKSRKHEIDISYPLGQLVFLFLCVSADLVDFPKWHFDLLYSPQMSMLGAHLASATTWRARTDAQYLRVQADLCLEMARQVSDRATADNLRAKAPAIIEAAEIETGVKMPVIKAAPGDD